MKTQSQGTSGGLSGVLSDAQAIIAAAEQRAEEILTAATESAEEMKRRGYAEGFAVGEQKASETAVRLLRDVGILQEEISREAARLALSIARSILGEQLSLNQTYVVELARQALEHSVSGNTVTLLAHPNDVATLKKEEDKLRRVIQGGTLKIESEPSLSKGSCIVRTDFGEVDASIEAIIKNLAEKLGV